MQRTFSVEDYTKWLLECGYDLLNVSADFKHEDPSDESERILFVARKG